MSRALKLENLIKDFLANEISIQQFESDYIFCYTQDQEDFLSENLFEIFDWLFFQVDAYTDLPLEPGDDPDHFINESQLREAAAKTLEKLQALNKK